MAAPANATPANICPTRFTSYSAGAVMPARGYMLSLYAPNSLVFKLLVGLCSFQGAIGSILLLWTSSILRYDDTIWAAHAGALMSYLLDTYDSFLVKEQRRSADTVHARLVDSQDNVILLDGHTDHNREMDVSIAYFWGQFVKSQ